MKKRFKPLYRLTGISIICAAAAGAAHAATSCATVGPAGTPGFTIAVASNFAAPMTSLVNSYLTANPGLGYGIQICQDSSGNLANTITSGNASTNGPYAVFFSADTSKPTQVSTPSSNVIGSPVNYAKGVPVFLLSPAAYAATSGTYRALNYLNTGLASGATAVASSADLPGVTNKVSLKRPPVSRGVSYLAIGKPDLAPYGLAAAYILGYDPSTYPNNMGQWDPSAESDLSSNVTATCSSQTGSGQWVCTYSNIDYTLQAINNNSVTAGFVAYSQVCPVWTGSTYPVDQYVSFPDYETLQSYVQLAINVPSTDQTNASAFLSYLAVGGSAWNRWLIDNCYNSL